MVKRYRWVILMTVLSLGLANYFSLPRRLFDAPLSRVLLDKSGVLLGASIANDGQWRFPPIECVPEKVKQAMILFEDQRFYSHPGIDPLALFRAIRQNVKAGEVISGASTIPMQVIRLSRQQTKRTYVEKVIEGWLALSLSMHLSKEEVIALYASYAPFGGNVVGLEAACWRYYGRSPEQLSWAEAALMAVLPNNPSLLRPGRNTADLVDKRNRLLDKMGSKGILDSLSLVLAKAELLPRAPLPLPSIAPHLLTRTRLDGLPDQKFQTTIDHNLQDRVSYILQDHHHRLIGNNVFNGAVLVANVNSGEVLAYVGNTKTTSMHHGQVDIIASPRSTGSILKPFLFAAMLREGLMLPKQLQLDVPTFINGFVPKNFSRSYDGAVPADQALIRSLNIPAVHQLRKYRFEKFYSLLEQMGMTTLHQPSEHYGLSLILGGAEGTLWDITGMYASMGRTLNRYFDRLGANRYDEHDFHPLRYLKQDSSEESGVLTTSSFLNAGEIYLTLEVLKALYRPGEETGWKHFSSTRPVAWKTGTSYGFRDAWAVGLNRDYVVGVWVGNADGEGRPDLTGTLAAAPILFDVMSALPPSDGWFDVPHSELVEQPTCRESGMRPSSLCETIDTVLVTKAGSLTPFCRYHKQVYCSKDLRYRLHSQCASVADMVAKSYFVLPTVQEHYYRRHHWDYQPLPPFRSDCADVGEVRMMDLIYPKINTVINLPRNFSGNREQVIFEAAHRQQDAEIFWYLDGLFMGATTRTHRLPLMPEKGEHVITLVDDQGETIQRSFEVL